MVKLYQHYLKFSFIGGLLGFSFSLGISVELNNPFSVLGSYFYYVCLTTHGLVMMFYFLTPLSLGFYNYFMCNTTNMKNFYWCLKMSKLFCVLMSVSFLFVLVALFVGESCNVGWTLYPPLSSKKFSGDLCLDFLLVGINLYLISTVGVSLVTLTTLFFISFSWESFLEAPVFIWSFLLTSFLVLFSTPSLFCTLSMLLLDSNFNTFYFNSEFGGSSLLFQSLFWVYSHPQVYVVILPVFGVVSQSLFIICSGFLYNKSGVVFSMVSLAILSFLVWGHHMTTVGWGLDMKNFFMVCTLVISLPTGVKVFSWLYTLGVYGGQFNLMTGSLTLFMLFFSLGGITGVFLANYSLDLMFHDSYFVVGHFHTVLSSAALFGFLSGGFLFLKSVFILNSLKTKVVDFIWVYWYLLIFMSLLQFLYSLHLLGLVGAPSSVSNVFFHCYLLTHFGSLSFLGVWLSLFLFLFMLLSGMNGVNGK